MDKNYIALLVAVAVAAGGVGYAVSHALPFPVDGIACEPMERTGFHVHAHLELWVGGREVVVPANIGVVRGCFYWLHTHTADGVIHVEAPEDKKFTLGQFWAVWGASAPQPEPGAAVWVDRGSGFLSEPGDWQHIVLSDQEKIVIGAAAPRPYTFPDGL